MNLCLSHSSTPGSSLQAFVQCTSISPAVIVLNDIFQLGWGWLPSSGELHYLCGSVALAAEACHFCQYRVAAILTLAEAECYYFQDCKANAMCIRILGMAHIVTKREFLVFRVELQKNSQCTLCPCFILRWPLKFNDPVINISPHQCASRGEYCVSSFSLTNVYT